MITRLPALLTPDQKALLRRLVAFHLAGRIKERFTPIPVGGPPSEFVIHILREPSFRFRRISDLDALCDAGLLTFRWNRQGTGKVYTFTEAGLQAVEDNFASQSIPGFGMHLQELMATLSAGTIVPEWPGAEATITAIAADPLRRHKHVDRLVEALLDVVHPHLAWPAFAQYERLGRDLRTAVLDTRPDPDTLATLWTALLRTGVRNLPPDALPAALTYLYPMLLIGLARQTTRSISNTPGDLHDRPR